MLWYPYLARPQGVWIIIDFIENMEIIKSQNFRLEIRISKEFVNTNLLSIRERPSELVHGNPAHV